MCVCVCKRERERERDLGASASERVNTPKFFAITIKTLHNSSRSLHENKRTKDVRMETTTDATTNATTSTTTDTKNALLSKLIAQSRAELDDIEAHITASSPTASMPSFSILKRLVRELEHDEEEKDKEEEGTEEKTFKPPKGAIRIPGMEAGGALGKEFLQNLKLKNAKKTGEEEEHGEGDEATQKPAVAAKPAWMIELAAKKAAARAKEAEEA